MPEFEPSPAFLLLSNILVLGGTWAAVSFAFNHQRCLAALRAGAPILLGRSVPLQLPILMFGLFFGLQIVGQGVVGSLLGDGASLLDASPSLLLGLGALSFTVGLLPFILHSIQNPEWLTEQFSTANQTLRSKPAFGALFYLATFPVLTLLFFLWDFLLKAVGYEAPLQWALQILQDPQSPASYILFFVGTVVLAPIFEEILFRGLILPLISKKLGLVAGVLISSILFSLLHMSMIAIVPLVLLAVFLSLAYIASESIVVPIVMHSVFNAVSAMMMFMGPPMEAASGGLGL